MNLKMLEDMNLQSELYRPSIFWSEASKEILKEFQENGIENFRRLNSPLVFFVPTYGLPGNGLNANINAGVLNALNDASVKQKETLTQFLTGYQSALSDYRVFVAANANGQNLQFLNFSESEFGNPIEQFEFDGNKYSRSALNYLLGLSFLQNYVDINSLEIVLEIGGGFGTLGEILIKSKPTMQYVDIDIPPTAFASEYYLKQVFGDSRVSSYSDTCDMEHILLKDLKPISVLGSWQLEKLEGDIDLFVNFISFQEMEPAIVENYLANVNRLKSKWILLRNMREGKQTRSQHRFGVNNPIFSEDYLKMLPNYELIQRNVLPFGFKTVDGFHSELMLFKRSSL